MIQFHYQRVNAIHFTVNLPLWRWLRWRWQRRRHRYPMLITAAAMMPAGLKSELEKHLNYLNICNGRERRMEAREIMVDKFVRFWSCTLQGSIARAIRIVLRSMVSAKRHFLLNCARHCKYSRARASWQIIIIITIFYLILIAMQTQPPRRMDVDDEKRVSNATGRIRQMTISQIQI